MSKIFFTHLHLADGKFGVLYRFPKRGDGIPMHQHDPSTEHTITCTSGRIMVHGPNFDHAYELQPGDRLEFNSAQPHEILALIDGSSVLNEFLHGEPESYTTLPPEERDGMADMQVTLRLTTKMNGKHDRAYQT